MTFNNFIITISNCFTNFFTHIIDLITPFLENNFIKLIICFSVLSFIIYLLFELFNIVYIIFDIKHDKKEEINLLNGENLDKKNKKTGDNIKKKDIYW